jgi:hypothetical protein
MVNFTLKGIPAPPVREQGPLPYLTDDAVRSARDEGRE